MMNKKILTLLCGATLLATPTAKPISPAVTAVTCGVIGAAVVGLWNLDLSPKAPASKNQAIITGKTSFAQLVQKHKEQIVTITKIVTGGAALAFIGYKAHPIIASIFKITPRLTEEQKALKVLGLGTNATEQEIKKTFRKLSLKHHPDKNPGDPTAKERIQEINEAYEFLTKKKK